MCRIYKQQQYCSYMKDVQLQGHVSKLCMIIDMGVLMPIQTNPRRIVHAARENRFDKIMVNGKPVY